MEAYMHGGVQGAIAAAVGPWAIGKAARGASNYFASGAMNSAYAATRLASPRFEQMVKGGQSAPIILMGVELGVRQSGFGRCERWRFALAWGLGIVAMFPVAILCACCGFPR
jgi:hypothetical protein